MQVANDYDKEVFNGDLGLVRAIDAEAGELVVDFDGREVAYDFGELDELVLAYATTVHKAQGSEYPAVVIPLTTQHYPMLQRNLLYTGVTRGRAAGRAGGAAQGGGDRGQGPARSGGAGRSSRSTSRAASCAHPLATDGRRLRQPKLERGQPVRRMRWILPQSAATWSATKAPRSPIGRSGGVVVSSRVCSSSSALSSAPKITA